MAIYRGTGGFSNVTGTAEIEYVTQKSVEIQATVAEIELLASEITSNTSAAQAAADRAVAASNGIQGFTNLASTKAGEAQVSAAQAATSAGTATTQALAASTSEANASASATSAANSATFAGNSASTATTQAGIATTKASEASTSELNAANSASSASTSANTATTAASTATTKASEAEASAAAAAQSAIDAATFDPSSYYIKSETDTLLSAKQATLVSGTNIKTVGGASLLGSGDIAISSGSVVIDNKTAAYTVVEGDLGKVINCTANSFTVSLTSAVTLGAGFTVSIKASGGTSSAITITPSGTEKIDGFSSLVLRGLEFITLVSTGSGWLTQKDTMFVATNGSSAYVRPIASGASAVAIGSSASATNTNALAFGSRANATGGYSFAVGLSFNADTTASGQRSIAIGVNSSDAGSTSAGSSSIALGGSYASGADSFSTSGVTNASSFGATGASSIAIGKTTKASSNNSIAIGTNCVSSNGSATAIGSGCEASSTDSFATGSFSLSAHGGKAAHANGRFSVNGDAQTGCTILRGTTTDATIKTLTSNDSTVFAWNQVGLSANATYAFNGVVVAQRSKAQGSQTAAWEIKGLITRGATAATTTLVANTVTAISNTPSWTLTLSADTTNGVLDVKVTGAASTNIRWVAKIETVEVIYS
jgi:hypothetical protein